MKIDRFEDIDAWKRSMELCQQIYGLAEDDSFSNDFRFKDQILASAVSIPSNIAEGFERLGDQELIRFLSIAKGSAGELRTQIHIAFNVGYIDEDQFEGLYSEVMEISRMILGLIKYLQSSTD